MAAQQRVVALVIEGDPEVMVPACPDWSATDVVRHLAGLSADTTNGIFDGFASDEWTAQQVDDRSGMSLREVVEEWNETIGAAAAVLDDVESLGLPDPLRSALGPIPVKAIGPMAISDILHHEFDLRNAYGDVSGRDRIEVHAAAAGHARSIRGTFAAKGLPTIRIESTDAGVGWDIGRDAPVATLRASSFEIMRATGGRRTRSEMAALDWDGDPEPFLDAMVLPHLSMPETSLHE